MRLDFIACKYTHFIQYGKTIEYFFAKRIRNFAEIKRISPPNGSHKTITKKQGVLWQYLQPIITQYFIDNKSEIWLLFLIAHSKR